MREQEALGPDALLSRAIEAALALSAASVSAEMQPAESAVLAQLVELSSDLAGRVAALEEQQASSCS